MMQRLTASIIVSALIRKAEAEGGFAAVISKGDPALGAILLILAEKGRRIRFLERILNPAGFYVWQDVFSQIAEKEEESEKFLDRRRRYDPDLWILELDIPSEERFAAEINQIG